MTCGGGIRTCGSEKIEKCNTQECHPHPECSVLRVELSPQSKVGTQVHLNVSMPRQKYEEYPIDAQAIRIFDASDMTIGAEKIWYLEGVGEKDFYVEPFFEKQITASLVNCESNAQMCTLALSGLKLKKVYNVILVIFSGKYDGKNFHEQRWHCPEIQVVTNTWNCSESQVILASQLCDSKPRIRILQLRKIICCIYHGFSVINFQQYEIS